MERRTRIPRLKNEGYTYAINTSYTPQFLFILFFLLTFFLVIFSLISGLSAVYYLTFTSFTTPMFKLGYLQRYCHRGAFLVCLAV